MQGKQRNEREQSEGFHRSALPYEALLRWKTSKTDAAFPFCVGKSSHTSSPALDVPDAWISRAVDALAAGSRRGEDANGRMLA